MGIDAFLSLGRMKTLRATARHRSVSAKPFPQLWLDNFSNPASYSDFLAQASSRIGGKSTSLPMHIGLFSPGWPLNDFTNGIVTYVHTLRGELLAQGHRVSVFTNQVGNSNRDRDIHCIAATLAHRASGRLRRLLDGRYNHVFNWGEMIASKVNSVHRSDPIDILEMEESFGWCASVQHRVPFPVVVKLHGPAFLTLAAEERNSDFAAEKIETEGRALRQIRALTSPSVGTLNHTMSHYVLRPELRGIIPNPVTTDESLPAWNIETCDKKTLLFVGRFDKPKGGDAVLEAFRKLLDSAPDLRLVFVGPDVGLGSPTGERIFFEQFRDRLFDPRQREQIDFLGKQARERLHALRNGALLTLVLSRWENQPNTALEAMIQGCPVVGFGGGGMDEVIENGKTGLLSPSGDIDALCHQVLEVVNDPHVGVRLGSEAKRVVSRRHSAKELVATTLEFYTRCINAGGTSPVAG